MCRYLQEVLDVLISLARVMLFRASNDLLDCGIGNCLNLSCESNAFQGGIDVEKLRRIVTGLNLSCESNAFQG